MVDKKTVLSTTEPRLTLLQYLIKVEDMLKKDTLKSVTVIKLTDTLMKLRFNFNDDTYIDSDPIKLSGGSGGTIDAGDLLTILKGSQEVIIDLAEDGVHVEVHLDELWKQSLALKTDLAKKQDKLSQVDLDNIASINQYMDELKTKVTKFVPIYDKDNPAISYGKENGLNVGENIVSAELIKNILKYKSIYVRNSVGEYYYLTCGQNYSGTATFVGRNNNFIINENNLRLYYTCFTVEGNKLSYSKCFWLDLINTSLTLQDEKNKIITQIIGGDLL